jgi:hypothetical protein
MTSAVYVYCIVKGARKPSTARLPAGLPGADRPAAHPVGTGLWLVAASVPLAQYGTEALEPSLRDLEWVGSIALAHDAVVAGAAATRGATVIPMKLFTMFSTLDRAIAAMKARRRELARVFRLIAGCEEWGVRVLRDSSRSSPPAMKISTPAGSGTAFLAARKQARDESRLAAQAAAEAADAAFDSLAAIARDGRRRVDAGPVDGRPLLDAAFLVPARGRRRFRAAAQRLARDLARRGGRLTLTGPWPPYNFVSAAEGE